ncbi:MAG TPA: homocysteine S-methyltransferase family protein [Polyangiaceae bacterium]|jgi:5-methyltetrahydrofolate--homocysteine methyltransferase
MGFEQLRHRLQHGRPLVMDADAGASFRARGVALDTPGALGALLRQRPLEVLDHYRAEVHSRVDVLCALTADTTPRALAEVGMQHRSAALTSQAVELAFEAAESTDKPVAIAGVVASDMVSPIAADRLHEELSEHAARVAAAGAELLLARGQGARLSLMAAVVAAASTDLPTWAVIECAASGDLLSGGSALELIESLQLAGASAILFEVVSVDRGLEELARAHWVFESAGSVPGVLLAGSSRSVRGFEDPDSEPERWVSRALELSAAGARVLGGGASTTETHTAALAHALGALHPSLPSQRSDTELGGPKHW